LGSLLALLIPIGSKSQFCVGSFCIMAFTLLQSGYSVLDSRCSQDGEFLTFGLGDRVVGAEGSGEEGDGL
jgi:hypothetical protein